MIPELTYQKMTVGKIYAGLLIAENWKAYKTSQSRMGNVMGMVSIIEPWSMGSNNNTDINTLQLSYHKQHLTPN